MASPSPRNRPPSQCHTVEPVGIVECSGFGCRYMPYLTHPLALEACDATFRRSQTGQEAVVDSSAQLLYACKKTKNESPMAQQRHPQTHTHNARCLPIKTATM